MWYSRIILNFIFIWKFFVKVIFKFEIKESYYINIYFCIWVVVDIFLNFKNLNKRLKIIVLGV